MFATKVDLNCDMGESFGAYRLGEDEQVLSKVSSVNVACGWHAGDPLVLERTVALAKQAGVAVGAHPGYPDLLGFGRRNLSITPDEARTYVKYQVGALSAFTKSVGVPLQHVKLHGAFYNQASVNPELAAAVCRGIAQVDDSLIVLALAGSQLLEIARAQGLRVASEVFADRAYHPDGTLVSRRLEGAVIHDPTVAVQRVKKMVTEGTVVCITGEEIPISAQSICVHGDNPQAVAFTQRIRDMLTQSNVEITCLNEVV